MLQLVHELPGRPSGTAAAADLPGGGCGPELFRREVCPRLFRKCGDDLLVFLKGGGRVEDLQAEAAGQRQLFLHGVGAMNVTVVLHIAAVAPHLPHQMAAVGGGAVNKAEERTALIYQKPLIDYESPRALTQISNFYNDPKDGPVRGYVLHSLDRFSLSDEGFSGTPKKGGKITTITDGKLVVTE